MRRGPMTQPDDLALHPGCGLTPPCASQAEMRERHGTPYEFAVAVYSCPDISGREAEIAAERYREAYEAAGLNAGAAALV